MLLLWIELVMMWVLLFLLQERRGGTTVHSAGWLPTAPRVNGSGRDDRAGRT